ncbi:uncharacterized protein PV06_00104 [Exophiala oligosperma]|uniref:COP9 signalosome complex subunit 6 n=1 Tax=Exophiala oligosperma TaxID=215243 RepID=A0A0D2CBU1_9EURO|nr:uncharacterized protein PV06_00104 [Exophiala oligosperma]KIW47407.1 hypothetical protein PV06_00104 [Exophiala oligosperma]
MAEEFKNPLISSKPSDSGLSVSLHPLALLTISDHVTRHSVRNQKGPIVGALLGQQTGREVTAEHAYPTDLVKTQEGGWEFNISWMEARTQQYKDVHKAPALDFVGWYTLAPESGPLPDFTRLQQQAMTFSGDTTILLVLHPEAIAAGGATGGKLPITIYESASETEPRDDDGSMQVDGQEHTSLRFKSLPYSIETDETEMIAIDYVAKGAGSAAAVTDSKATGSPAGASESKSSDKKGKKRADAAVEVTNGSESANDKLDSLTPEEQDQMANMTTRLNSVKMLQSRIALMRTFIQSLPPSYLTDQESAAITPDSPDPAHIPHLRNIQALITRLSLITPMDSAASSQPLAEATHSQANDVAMAKLLALLGQDIQALSEFGRKYSAIETARNALRAKHASGGSKTYDALAEGDGHFGRMVM